MMEQEDAQSPISYQNLKSPENIWILLHFSDSFIHFLFTPFEPVIITHFNIYKNQLNPSIKMRNMEQIKS
jgi:hypothetical protein